MALTMQQSTALSVLKTGINVFLTGSAGTGKTYVLNQYIQYLKDRKVRVAVTASTGIAATHMNGMTIHAWSGIGVKQRLTTNDLNNMAKKKYLKDHVEKVKVLIIDEVSMLHKNQLDMVDQVLRFFKLNNKPFGGIQVVFCGDFYQLPPVSDNSETSRDKFAFMAMSWLDANPAICYLTEQYRQSDNALNGILDQIRQGRISAESIDRLNGSAGHVIPISPTRLHTHNVDVDRINKQFLNELAGESKFFKASTSGNEKLVAVLSNSVLAETDLELKQGARVMFVKNNYEKGYVNGSLGEVVGFDIKTGLPNVKLSSGKVILANPEKWSVKEDGDKTLASFNQIPLRLAWAITIHKSQGMTLEAAEIDLSKTFERGQGYVALSRLKSLKNLRLLGLNQTALEVDGLAMKADVRFRELSSDVEVNLEQADVDSDARRFMIEVGGLTDDAEIARHKKKMAIKKEVKEKKKKENTYALTKEAIVRGLSIQEIAEERALSETTIIGHIIKIKGMYPEINLARFKPKKGVINKVKGAIEHIRERDGLKPTAPVSMDKIYYALNRQVAYTDVKLALIFI